VTFGDRFLGISRRRFGLGGKFALLAVALTAAGVLVGGARAADPTFAPSPGSPFAVGSAPDSVAVGDLNGDGHPDLVTANAGANTVSVLLGDGGGGFSAAPGSPFAVGSAPASVAVGDLNGDGHPDLVTANYGDNTDSVLLGDGGGGFSAAPGSPFAAGPFPAWVAVGDLNGDGHPDLVTANSDTTVSVLLGDGGGGFSAAPGSPFAVGAYPESVAIGDLNGDGHLDLVDADYGDNTVSVLLGDGGGGFSAAPGSPFAVGAYPYSVAVGDLNGDGRPDLVTANAGDNTVSVLLGDGGGGFSAAPGSPFAVGANPYSVAVGDLNGDGHPDLVTANGGSNDVSVLLNTTSASPADSTPPSASPIVLPVANGAGWNATDATVSWHWADNAGGSGIDPAHCTSSSTSAGEGTITLNATCTDLAGNTGSASYAVKVDKTPPMLAVTGNAGTYAVDQTVAIACAATDSLSGIATACSGISGPAVGFGVGTHTVTLSATDLAGNTASENVTFTVSPPTGKSLANLTKQYVDGSARYAALNRAQKAVVDVLAGAATQAVAAIVPHLSPAQKTALERAYAAALGTLVREGWLTASQAVTLQSLAAQL